ncbi:MAG: hypothetical protein IJ214_05590, partial [Clostridia bacterium]|nr:hypothetical protein [Clostridia bacterium]
FLFRIHVLLSSFFPPHPICPVLKSIKGLTCSLQDLLSSSCPSQSMRFAFRPVRHSKPALAIILHALGTFKVQRVIYAYTTYFQLSMAVWLTNVKTCLKKPNKNGPMPLYKRKQVVPLIT